MSTGKSIAIPANIMNAVAVSSTSTFTSSSFYTGNLDSLFLDISWTGTPTGTITINVSKDGSTWRALSGVAGMSNPAGSASNTNGALLGAPFPWPYLQVSYTNASGSGTMTVFVGGKGV